YDKMNTNELYENKEIIRKYNRNYKNNFCYKSVVLYNNACDDEKWNILKYENNNIFIYSKHSPFLYDNKLLILQDVSENEYQDDCVGGNYYDDNVVEEKKNSEIENKSNNYISTTKERRLEEYYLKKENIYLHDKINFYEINLLNKFKKHLLNYYKLDILNRDDYKEGGLLREKLKKKETIKSINNMNKIYSVNKIYNVNNFHYKNKNKKLVFYHPILLLNYIKIGLFSHVHVSLKLLLHILLNIFYKERTTYNIKKNCALRFIIENKKLEKTHYNYQDISCSLKKSQFVYDLNFIHCEIYNMHKNKKESLYSSNNLPREDNNFLTKKKLEQKEEEKENKDKSIYLFENESISLDDFNLNSDDDDDKEEKEEKNNNKKKKNYNNNINNDDDDDDDDNSLLSDDEDKLSELSNSDNNSNNEKNNKNTKLVDNEEKKLKEYLKYSNVINYELNIEEIKILQILLLHINVPRLNNFFQLILYCMLNSFYYNMDYVCEEAKNYMNKENNDNSDDDNYNNQNYSDDDHHD
ncbi:putative membrane protein, partial [Plasmodium gaboni]